MRRDTAIFMLPVQSGRTRLAIALLEELKAVWWKQDGRMAMESFGVASIAWYVSIQPTATFLIAQIEGVEPVRGFLVLTMAENDNARWLRACLSKVGGLEVNPRTLEHLMLTPLVQIRDHEPPAGATEGGAPVTPSDG